MYRPRRLEYELVLSSVGLVLTEVRRQSNATNARNRYQAPNASPQAGPNCRAPIKRTNMQTNKHGKPNLKLSEPGYELRANFLPSLGDNLPSGAELVTFEGRRP